MHKLALLIALASFPCLAGVAGAQVSPGTPSFSAYDSHAVDTINLQNLNILINSPIRSNAGAFPFNYSLHGNFYMGTGHTNKWAPMTTVVGAADGFLGWFTAAPSGGTTILCPDGVHYTNLYQNWYVETADGTFHWLPTGDYTDTRTDGSGLSCYNQTFTDQVLDGTGLTLVANKTTATSVYDRSGNVYAPGVTSTQMDSNGNVAKVAIVGSSSVFTDTLNTTALTVPGATGGTYIWTDINGGSPQATFNTSSQELKTVFGCSNFGDLTTSGTDLPAAISDPDGTSIAFGYEVTPGSPGNVTGRLGQLTLRTGGQISYSYSGSNNGLNCTYQIPPTLQRQTSDGTSTYTWTAVNNGGGNYGNTTAVTDQGGNKTVYTFTGLTATGNAALPVTQALTEIQHYQGSSTLLTTDLYCYNGASGQPGNCSTAVVSLPITELDVYHTINGMGTSSRNQMKYDKYGNLTYSAQYDFGSISPTFATTTTYGSWNGSACVAVSSTVNNRPCTIVTTEYGWTIAQSRFSYDSHGNLLTSYKWNGSSFLSNSTPDSYNANGTIATSYDLANNPTSYAYNGSGGCNNLFPTSVTKGGLTTKTTWNCTGGVKLTDTDANGNVTSYGYTDCVSDAADPFWRVMSVTDPLGNKVCRTYPSGTSPATVTNSFAFNSGNSIQGTTTTIDGYGRTLEVQNRESPTATNYDTVSTQYGWLGNYRQVKGTLPCPQTLGNPCSFTSPNPTTSLFDPLGRPYTVTDGGGGVVTKTYAQNDVLTVLSPAPTNENNKRAQKEYDGLGRLRSSCGVMSSGGYSSCSQSTGSYSGVFTTYSYSAATGTTTTTVARGLQTRSTTLDALGRVTRSVTPEGGTWQHYYDSSYSSCPSGYTGAPGQLAATVDPNGNVLCYKYDSLNRAIGVNANGTTCLGFSYDTGSVPNGVTPPTNSLGRMIEAYTYDCSTTLITDEWFGYDADGHVTDMWEKTPHSGQYYHSKATFFGNGVVNVLTLANPNLFSSTYTLDGEGRWNQMTTYGVTIVPSSGVTFNAASQPTLIDIGSSGDSDIYTYDANTGRMKTWQFTVGTKNESAALNWNPNGTLNNLAITDGFNSGGSQTCYYNPSSGSGMGYDDLGRLLNVSCGTNGSIWNQTFSYDQYNNITKASNGPGLSWSPGYSSSNNHYTLAGTSYDSNGDLLNDTMHQYTWNEFSKLKTVDSSGCGTNGECVTYDALGRAVETSNGSAYTEIWYTQLGKTAYMNGRAFAYAYWPTPGGGTLLQTVGYTYYFQHKDWLGNARVSSNLLAAIIDDRAFAPYGEMYQNFGSTSANELIFTGDTQDIVAGTYDTPNRELNPSQGRWISPDPAGAGWNLYAYATNPNNQIDPTGLGIMKVVPPGEGEGTSSVGGGGGYDPLQVLDTFGTLNISVNSSGSNGGSVAADSGTSSSSSNQTGGEGISQAGIADFANWLGQTAATAWVAAIFQSAADADDKDEDDFDPDFQWGQALEPLKPGEFVWPSTGWRYNLLEPGPLPESVASTFAGGQYTPMTVGGEGWSFDGLYRVYGGASGETGANGTFYSIEPQVGGLQSAIDGAVNPNWGSAGNGGSPYSNGLNMANVLCVYLQPGTQAYVGPISSQGGAWVGGGIQVYVPPQ